MTPPDEIDVRGITVPTVRECDSRHEDIARRLSRIEGKVDTLTERLAKADGQKSVLAAFVAMVTTGILHVIIALFSTTK